MCEIPSVISDDVESESTEPDVPDKNVENDSPESLQTTHKQGSFLTDVQKEAKDRFEPETTTLDIAEHVKHESNSPKSILRGASEVPLCVMATASSRDTLPAGAL